MAFLLADTLAAADAFDAMDAALRETARRCVVPARQRAKRRVALTSPSAPRCDAQEQIIAAAPNPCTCQLLASLSLAS
jgi:hypothetical protein